MKTTQTGFVVIYTMVGITLMSLLMLTYNKSIPVGILGGAISVPVLLALFFYKLTVEVTDQELLLKFGIGLIRKRIRLDSIQKVEAVKNPFLLGWGIRSTFDYTVYNVSGFDAIELTLQGRTRKIRVGTDSTGQLLTYLTPIIAQKGIREQI